MRQIVLSKQSQTGMRFVSDTCPERPLGGLCLVSRGDLLSLFPRNVCQAVKETPSVKTAHREHGGDFLLTEN